MVALLSTEIYILCIVVLLTLFFSIDRITAGKADVALLIRLVNVVVLVLLEHLIWMFLLEGHSSTAAVASNYLLNISIFCLSLYASFLWLRYVNIIVSNKEISKAVRIAELVPVALALLLVCLTPWTHWIFYIDGAGCYVRGCFFTLYYALCLLYVVYACSKFLLVFASAKISKSQKKKTFHRFLYCAFPLLGALITFFNQDCPAYWSSFTIALTLIYIDMKYAQIFSDPLTGMNNRQSYNEFLENFTDDDKEKSGIIFVDLNRFKQINDEFGHQEGDCALKVAAGLLKNVAGAQGVFAARIGGDEFVLVARQKGEEKIQEIIQFTYKIFEDNSVQNPLPYLISVSLGYGMYRGSIEAMLEEADQSMYREKERAHKKIPARKKQLKDWVKV
ncbi:MAG: GGDEF domain-containing protein [Fibrobacteraceae bacterium]|nr:GGDEF domain-containing protein [Fibrobacteraceae bacterium]